MHESAKLCALSVKKLLMCQHVLLVYVLACQRALHAYVITCQLVLRALLLTCYCTLGAYVFMCSRANVLSVLLCSRGNMPWVLTCLAWQHALHASILTCQRGFRPVVLTWQHCLIPLPHTVCMTTRSPTCFASSLSDFDAIFSNFTAIVVEVVRTFGRV